MKAIFISLFLLSTSTWGRVAHLDQGRGSQAYVCRDVKGQVVSAELWDFYEAREINQLILDIGQGTLSLEEALQLLIKRLKKLSPERAEIFAKKSSIFLNEFYFIYGQNLPDMGEIESLPGNIPSSCAIEQLLLQKNLRLPGEKRFTVNGDIWLKLNNENRAGVLFHELAYEDGRLWRIDEYETNKTQGIRHWNAAMASEIELAKLKDQKSVYLLFHEALFSWIELGDVQIRISYDIEQPRFYPNGRLVAGYALHKPVMIYGSLVYTAYISYFEDGSVESVSIDTPDIYRGDQPLYFHDSLTGAKFDGLLKFYRGGRVKAGNLAFSFEDPITKKTFRDDLTFNQDGRVATARLDLKTKHYSFKYGNAYFNPEGQLQSYITVREGEILTSFGKMIRLDTYHQSQEILFDENELPRQGIYPEENTYIIVQDQEIKILYHSMLELSGERRVAAFYPDGKFAAVKLLVGGKLVAFHARAFFSPTMNDAIQPQLTFYPGNFDTLASGWLSQKVTLSILGGGVKEFPAHTHVQFNQNGEVIP